jgi:hypothetical protein
MENNDLIAVFNRYNTLFKENITGGASGSQDEWVKFIEGKRGETSQKCVVSTADDEGKNTEKKEDKKKGSKADDGRKNIDKKEDQKKGSKVDDQGKNIVKKDDQKKKRGKKDDSKPSFNLGIEGLDDSPEGEQSPGTTAPPKNENTEIKLKASTQYSPSVTPRKWTRKELLESMKTKETTIAERKDDVQRGANVQADKDRLEDKNKTKEESMKKTETEITEYNYKPVNIMEDVTEEEAVIWRYVAHLADLKNEYDRTKTEDEREKAEVELLFQ